ncbi:ion transporter [Ramlibacter sp. MAHUQ-53]|uniref:ion transporter n=1 Tax=unclassified Ramlibacter TaxID=2617605 RepID=UPI003627542A
MTSSPTISSSTRLRMQRVIFGSDTPAGRAFDLVLMAMIVASVLVVVLDSIEPISAPHAQAFSIAEWFFTVVFSLEYAARLYCAPARLRYATSFFGLVDLVSVLPSYLALFFPELHALLDVRILRMLRIFRVLKLTSYLVEFRYLGVALAASRRKILVFLATVSAVVLVMGTVMYVVEGPGNGFTSIPTGVYWAITTMTTVGFGDITPKSDLGRAIASVMMLMGWGVLAVPTGIVTAAMVQRAGGPGTPGAAGLRVGLRCTHCGGGDLAATDRFCRHCGIPLAGPAGEALEP